MIALRVRKPATDQRTPDLLGRGRAIEQGFADQRLEAEWRRRVRANAKEQARITRWAREVHA